MPPKAAKKNNRGQGKSDRVLPAIPPALSTALRVNHVLRYVATAGATTVLTTRDLIESMVMGQDSSASGAAYPLFVAFKLKKFRMWSQASSASSPSVISVDWRNTDIGFAGTNANVSAVQVGNTQVAYLEATPPKDALCSKWFTYDGSTFASKTIAIIVSTAGTVLDMHFSAALRDSSSNPGISSVSTIVSPIVGMIYVRALAANTSADFVPASYPTK